MESQSWGTWLRFFVLTFYYLCTNQTKQTMEQNIEAALSTLKEKCDDLATINVLYADRVSALEKENQDLKAKLKLVSQSNK